MGFRFSVEAFDEISAGRTGRKVDRQRGHPLLADDGYIRCQAFLPDFENTKQYASIKAGDGTALMFIPETKLNELGNPAIFGWIAVWMTNFIHANIYVLS